MEPRPRIPVVTLCCAIVFAGLYVITGTQISEEAKTHDFLNIYAGARMAFEGRWAHLHIAEAQHEIENRYRDVDLVRPFVRPAFYAAVLLPLAALDYDTAFIVWSTLWWVVLAGCLLWAAYTFHPDAFALGALFLPTALGIGFGQDCVLLLTLVAMSFTLLERGKTLASGVAAGLLVIKFHLALLVPIFMVAQRRWRMLIGFSATATVCAGVSVVLVGPAGAREYIRLLTRNDLKLLSPGEALMLNVKSLLLNLDLYHPVAQIVLSGVVLAVAISAARGELWRFYAAACAATLLILPHTYAYDAAFLLPGLFATMYRGGNKAARVIAGILCTPLPYGLNSAGSPWAAVTPLLLIALLVSLSLESKVVRRNPTFEVAAEVRS